MTHKPDCKGAALVLEERRDPITGPMFLEICKSCGAVEPLTRQQAEELRGRGGYFIPTRV